MSAESLPDRGRVPSWRSPTKEKRLTRASGSTAWVPTGDSRPRSSRRSPGVRRITMECRGHGQSELGDEARISVAQFADDAVDSPRSSRDRGARWSGASRSAPRSACASPLIHPDRAAGLVLARPAWVDEHGPDHLKIYPRRRGPARHLRTPGRQGALRGARPGWRRSRPSRPTTRHRCAGSSTGHDPRSTVALLSRIPAARSRHLAGPDARR